MDVRSPGFERLESRTLLSADSTVVFNEIMYSPVYGDQDLEWIELYNRLAVDMDLSGWRLDGGVWFEFSEGTVLPGGGYLVVAKAPDELEATTGFNAALGPFAGQLSNAGEEIILRNNSGRLMDLMEYDDEVPWPAAADGSGASLAKIDPDSASGPAENWTASEQVGGTLGAANFPTSFDPIDSKMMLAIDATWKSEASGTDLGSAWRQPGFDDGAWDSVQVFVPSVLITEAGTANPDYVEIQNLSANTVDTADWVVAVNNAVDVNQVHTTFWELPNSMAAGEVRYRSDDSADVDNYWGDGISWTTRGSGWVMILDDQGNVADFVAWGYSAAQIASIEVDINGFEDVTVGDAWNGEPVAAGGRSGNSLQRTGDSDHDDASDWAFTKPQSRGAQNEGLTTPFPPVPIELAPGQTTYYFRAQFDFNDVPEQTELLLDVIVDDGAVFYLNSQEIYRHNMPPGEVTYDTLASTPVDEASFTHGISIITDALIQGTNVLAVEVHQVVPSDIDMAFGTVLTTVVWPPAWRTTYNDLALNEVAAGGEQPFWLELLNFGDQPLQIDGYVIASSMGNEHVLPAQSLAPGEFLAVTEAELGFDAAAGDRLFVYKSDRSTVLDGVRVDSSLRGRFPDGTGRWLYPDVATPAAANSFAFHDEIVINEIMYHHRPTQETAQVLQTSQPVAIEATWKYEQSDVFPGAAWNAPGFADGAWSSGEAILFAGPLSGMSDPTVAPITTLFGTGVDAGGQVVADGLPDPHYLLTASAQSVPPPPDIPATVISNHPAWLANDATSKWLGPVHPGTTSVAAGEYIYETAFDLTGFVPGTASISMRLSADDMVTDVLLGGVSTGISFSGFGAFSPTYTIDTGFVSGINTLSFVLNNGGVAANPAGFRAELSGTALPVPTNTVLQLGPSTYYFRTEFEFAGDPTATQLELVQFVDDGAVFYLNGVEVYRQNMPAGEILHSTLAASEVAGEATFGAPVVIPADALVAGTNVLAVEVHQAGGGFDDMALGAVLRATETLVEASPFGENPEEWIELYNRGGVAMDLSGWELDDGIQYAFDPGTTIGAGEYLVVAEDSDALRAKYPAIDYPDLDIVGDYSRRLSNFGERIALLDENNNPADEVHYFEGGRWPQFADGGGSSLELRDPEADNSVAEAWAASDEGSRSTWQTYSYRGIAADPPGSNNPAHFNEFIFGLLDAGEILIDDISVVEDPDGAAVEFIQNGSFTTGTSTWRLLGNHAEHGLTEVIADPDDPGNMVLRLVASGATEHMSNHIETTFANSETVVNGREYEISFRARWLGGSSQLNTRLYFNRLAHTTLLEVPSLGGTPGAPNTRLEANIGPTYSQFGHAPVMPEEGEDVTVSVVAADPDGMGAMTLWYGVDGGAFSSVTMASGEDGLYTGTIPGQGAAAVVQFYVEGEDVLGVRSTFPAAGADSRALYTVDDGRGGNGPNGDFRIIMTAEDAAFQLDGPGESNALSNHRWGATVVFKESDVYYDVGVRMKGSGYSRGSPTTGYNIRFDPGDLFRGVHDIVAVDRTSSAWGLGASHRELVVKHIGTHAGGIPSMYDELIYFIPPTDSLAASTAQLLMARYDDVFLDSSFANGSDGTRFKFELIYYPTGTIDGNPESPKPKPNTVLGVDVQDMGDDKESYRWNYLIKNQRARDDYSGMIDLGKTFSLAGSNNGGELDLRSQEVMDVDQWLRLFAFESLVGINDTYNQGLPHNIQFFVRPEDDRAVVLPWDMDFAFHQSTNMPVFGTGSNFRKIINIPNNLHYFYGHLQDILNTTYNTAYLTDWIDHYAAFAQRDVTTVILNYINNRRAYVLSQLPAEVPFEITTNSGNDFSVDDVVATIEGNGWINVREIRLAGSSAPLDVAWTSSTSWQATVSVLPGANDLTFEAFDFQGSFVGTDSITVTSTVTDRPLQESLRITELNYHPADPTPDEQTAGFTNDDDFEFVELRNIGPDPLELTGVQFTDGIQFDFSGVYEGPRVLITEAGTGSPDYVEIQNVSDSQVNTAGWVVAVNNAVDLNQVHTTLWELPGSMAAGEVRYQDDNGTDVAHWGDGISWTTRGPGWVMLLDEQGNVADFVAWGYSAAQIASIEVDINGFQDVTVGGAWNGAPVAKGGQSDNSLQRSGDADHNDASDWAFTKPRSVDDDLDQGIQNAGLTVPFPGTGPLLGPGELMVIANNTGAFEARYGTGINVAGQYTGRLSNGGERITLTDSADQVIFDFQYGDSGDAGWPDRADGNGSSLELIDPTAVPLADPDRTAFLQDGNNWRSSGEYFGSPGFAGQGPYDDVVINEVLSHTDLPLVDAIELYNATAQAVDIGGWWLSDSSANYQKYQIPAGTILPGGGHIVFDESDFNPSGGVDPENHPNDFALNGAEGDDVWLLKGEVGGGATYFVEHVEFGAALSGESFGRWANSAGEFYLYPMTGRTLDPPGTNSGPRIGPKLLISEVMYNPPDPDGPGGLDPNDLEFVEIYNTTSQPVDLTEWRLGKEIDFDFADGTTLGPREALVVVPFGPSDPVKLADFRGHYGIDPSVQIVGGHNDNLGDDGGRVQLQDGDDPLPGPPPITPHPLEDEVDYEDTWHASTDGGGDSLNRLGSNRWGDEPASWAPGLPTPGAVGLVAEVGGRHIFYNNSAFDTGPEKTDDDAIAPDKTALLPGGTATFANYTSYVLGINGIIIDIFDLKNPADLRATDFSFKVGNNDDTSGWAPAAAAPTVEVRPDEGPGGSDRVTLIWPDGTIEKEWLEVTVLATAATGLAEADVFYFGNAIGEAGNSTSDAIVNVQDVIMTRSNPHPFWDPALIDTEHDFDRDQRVDATDILISRANQTWSFAALKLIDLRGGKAAEGADSALLTGLEGKTTPPAIRLDTGRHGPNAESPSAYDTVLKQSAGQASSGNEASPAKPTWLYEFGPTSTRNRPFKTRDSVERAVDKLLATDTIGMTGRL